MPFHLREWRKFMGAKPVDLAIALDVERESYYRYEREPWRLNLAEVEILAEAIGIKSSQFRFPPPEKGGQMRVSLDDLIEDVPENMQNMAIRVIREMIGKK